MIYVLDNGMHLKIGFTTNLEQRVKQLQTGSSTELKVVCVKHGDVALEQQLHSSLAKYKVQGEWFEKSPEVLEVLTNLVDYNQEMCVTVKEFSFNLIEWPAVKAIKEGLYGIDYMYIYRMFFDSTRSTKEIVREFMNKTQRYNELIPLDKFCDLIRSLIVVTNDLTARKIYNKMQGVDCSLPFLSIAQLHNRYKTYTAPSWLFL